jgi:hypothetical protein
VVAVTVPDTSRAVPGFVFPIPKFCWKYALVLSAYKRSYDPAVSKGLVIQNPPYDWLATRNPFKSIDVLWEPNVPVGATCKEKDTRFAVVEDRSGH